jgi:uncharacterized protein
MKTFIVDGHNLIPKIPGLSLSHNDDETRLLELLAEFARISRSRMEVFFDGAPPAQARQSKGGLIHAHFIRKSSSADDAIIQFLRSHLNERDGITVVTSDNRILSEARSLGIPLMRSEAFSREMITIFNSPATQQEKTNRTLTQEEIGDWMRVFSEKGE